MKDFENYLKDSRDNLKSSKEANGDLWINISHQLAERRSRRVRLITTMVASVAILLSVVTFIKLTVMESASSKDLLLAHSDEYIDVEKEFISAIKYEKSIIDNIDLTEEQEIEKASFIRGLRALDRAMESYKKIVDSEGYDEIMTELIIDNYQRKLDLLGSLRESIMESRSSEHNIGNHNKKSSSYEKRREKESDKISI